MRAEKRIILFGKSVILGTIGACLKNCSGFAITGGAGSIADPISLISGIYGRLFRRNF